MPEAGLCRIQTFFKVGHFSMLSLQRPGSALDTGPRAVFECKMHSFELLDLVINLLTFVIQEPCLIGVALQPGSFFVIISGTKDVRPDPQCKWLQALHMIIVLPYAGQHIVEA